LNYYDILFLFFLAMFGIILFAYKTEQMWYRYYVNTLTAFGSAMERETWNPFRHNSPTSPF
jgi:hypothetical protein